MTYPDLKPCPFCGAHLDYAAPVAYVHPVGKCILSGRNFAKGVIGQWNKRADQAKAAIAVLAERERAGRYRYVLGGVLAAIKTGRNEPLMVWRDQIEIALDDAIRARGEP